MPQTTWIVFNAFKTIRLYTKRFGITLFCFTILNNFHITATDMGKHPTCLLMILWQVLEIIYCLFAKIKRHMIKCFSKYFQQCANIPYRRLRIWRRGCFIKTYLLLLLLLLLLWAWSSKKLLNISSNLMLLWTYHLIQLLILKIPIIYRSTTLGINIISLCLYLILLWR